MRKYTNREPWGSSTESHSGIQAPALWLHLWLCCGRQSAHVCAINSLLSSSSSLYDEDWQPGDPLVDPLLGRYYNDPVAANELLPSMRNSGQGPPGP